VILRPVLVFVLIYCRYRRTVDGSNSGELSGMTTTAPSHRANGGIYFLYQARHRKLLSLCVIYSLYGSGQVSRCSDSIRAWRSGGSKPGGGEIFRTSPDRPCGPLSILYSWYRVFHGSKAAGTWLDRPPPSDAEVKERVELYIHSPCGPSWPVLGWTLPLLFLYSLYSACVKRLGVLPAIPCLLQRLWKTEAERERSVVCSPQPPWVMRP